MKLSDRTTHYALQSHVAVSGGSLGGNRAPLARSLLAPRQHKPPLISNLHLTFAHFRFLCTSGCQEWTSAARMAAEPEHLTAGRTGPTAAVSLPCVAEGQAGSEQELFCSVRCPPGMVGGSSFVRKEPIWRVANSCMETCQPKRQIDRRLDEEGELVKAPN